MISNCGIGWPKERIRRHIGVGIWFLQSMQNCIVFSMMAVWVEDIRER